MKAKEQTWYTPKRLEALADGVFAIVMTLLVLELAVPALTHDASNKELSQQLMNMWPKFISYCLSFMVLGVYWIIHHKIFENIRIYTSTLAWINIFFLMVVSLIPFTTSLIGEYFLKQTPTIIYGIQLLLMFLLGFMLFTHATRENKLVDDDYDIRAVKGAKRMGYLYISILLAAIITAFFTPLVSIIIYSAIVLVFVVFSALSKDEYVMAGIILKDENNE